MYIIPLTEFEPPSTLPRGAGMLRPSANGSGSVMKPHDRSGSLNASRHASGIGMRVYLRSSSPASSNRTLILGSSLRRAASTQPAEPPPTTM
jgi:hypothetical protein